MNLNNQNIRHILSRLALAVIFLGIGIWEIVQPKYWSGFVPTFLNSIINPNVLTMFQGAALVVIGFAVLIGLYLRAAAVLASLMMVAILFALVIETGFTDLVIRDATVLLLAISLIFDDTDYLRIRLKR